MTLSALEDRLQAHFLELRRTRSALAGEKPLFALEHGLNSDELASLHKAVRAHVAAKPPSSDHSLPWVVYAAEVGYRYSGAEYWQTFAEETPGWLEHGQREWIRDRYEWFHERFGGARPAGAWANHFSIICWPITHAILPCDLQRQLARILYQLRHNFSAELFSSPGALGELIASRAWEGNSRFEKLAQETLLVGQIAAALLLEGELGSAGLLLPSTLKRIGSDLDRERGARGWLQGARLLARERAQFKGLSVPRPGGPTTWATAERAREEAASLAIEPQLVLRPSGREQVGWDVLLDIPDLSHLLRRFPAVGDPLINSRCVVAGANRAPLARGGLLRGSQRVRLARWPGPKEVLLRFEKSTLELDQLLRTECLLRPGPTWLFKVASDGLAYELRTLRVRPGQRYLVLSTEPKAGELPEVALACDGVHAALLDLPDAIPTSLETMLSTLGVTVAASVRAWPAGLSAAGWDGQGRGEWLVTDRPRIALEAGRALESVTVTLSSRTEDRLELGRVPPGVPLFIEMAALPVGVWKLRVHARTGLADSDDAVGELDVVIREPRPWAPGGFSQGPMNVQVDPATPTLEELWEGELCVEIRGPSGRSVVSTLRLFGKDTGSPQITKKLPPLKLPVGAAEWRAHIEKHFQNLPDVANAYDSSRLCDVELSADELGTFNLRCERAFTPLRWAVRRQGRRHTVTLIDDSGGAGQAIVGMFPFEMPDARQPLDTDSVLRGFAAGELGGLFSACRGEFLTSVIVPPEVRRLQDIGCNPRVSDRSRSPQSALHLLRLFTLWSDARQTGNVFSRTRQHEVLLVLARHVFFILCGEAWERRETSGYGEAQGLKALEDAVAGRHKEGIAAELASQCAAFALAPTGERVGRFVSLAARFLGHQAPAGSVAASGARPGQANTVGFQWLAEFSLRLASDPLGAVVWAGPAVSTGVGRLFEGPTLARAARFLVLSVARQVAAQSTGPRRLYPGWVWE